MARATGVSHRAITQGIKELKQRKTASRAVSTPARIRRRGAGRKRAMDRDPGLLEDLDLGRSGDSRRSGVAVAGGGPRVVRS